MAAAPRDLPRPSRRRPRRRSPRRRAGPRAATRARAPARSTRECRGSRCVLDDPRLAAARGPTRRRRCAGRIDAISGAGLDATAGCCVVVRRGAAAPPGRRDRRGPRPRLRPEPRRRGARRRWRARPARLFELVRPRPLRRAPAGRGPRAPRPGERRALPGVRHRRRDGDARRGPARARRRVRVARRPGEGPADLALAPGHGAARPPLGRHVARARRGARRGRRRREPRGRARGARPGDPGPRRVAGRSREGRRGLLRDRAARLLPPAVHPAAHARRSAAGRRSRGSTPVQPRRAAEVAEAAVLASLPKPRRRVPIGRVPRGDGAGAERCLTASRRTRPDAWEARRSPGATGATPSPRPSTTGAKRERSGRPIATTRPSPCFGRVEARVPRSPAHAGTTPASGPRRSCKTRGDSARALSMLTSLPDAYPEGDMRGEALFRAAIDQLGARDLPGAAATLDRLTALPIDEAKPCCGGRGAYFRARVAQLSGDVAGAKARYAALLEAQPLTFYMLLASARLRALDPAAARDAMARGADREAPGPFLTAGHPELASASFDRFERLLEVGDVDAARREAAAGKLVAEGVDPEVLWTVGWAYDRAGAPDLGHAFSRARLTDYRAHWPAGRWKPLAASPSPRDAWDGVVPSARAPPRASPPRSPGPSSARSPRTTRTRRAAPTPSASCSSCRRPRASSRPARRSSSTTRPSAGPRSRSRSAPGSSAKMRASFPGNPALGIAAYNSGSGPVRRWLAERGGDDFDVFVERIPYEETRNYVKRVLDADRGFAYAYLYAIPPARSRRALRPPRADDALALTATVEDRQRDWRLAMTTCVEQRGGREEGCPGGDGLGERDVFGAGRGVAARVVVDEEAGNALAASRTTTRSTRRARRRAARGCPRTRPAARRAARAARRARAPTALRGRAHPPGGAAPTPRPPRDRDLRVRVEGGREERPPPELDRRREPRALREADAAHLGELAHPRAREAADAAVLVEERGSQRRDGGRPPSRCRGGGPRARRRRATRRRLRRRAREGRARRRRSSSPPGVHVSCRHGEAPKERWTWQVRVSPDSAGVTADGSPGRSLPAA